MISAAFSTPSVVPIIADGLHKQSTIYLLTFMEVWNVFSIFLIMTGLCLYFLDIGIDLEFDADFATGFDAVGIIAGICIVIGTFLLIGNSVWLIVVFAIQVNLVGLRWFARYRAIKSIVPYKSALANLMSQSGYTKTALTPRGLVQMRNELWSARSDTGEHIDKDVKVIVMDIEGSTITVSPYSQ